MEIPKETTKSNLKKYVVKNDKDIKMIHKKISNTKLNNRDEIKKQKDTMQKTNSKMA